MSETLLKVENVSKKFCKSLKHLMLYGVEDIARSIVGKDDMSSKLRDDEFWAVDDVSFEVKRGETVGIIGPNGSGKTTLLKLLNGIFMPDMGKISVKGRVGVLIHVGAGFHPMLTGRENVYVNGSILGMTKREIDRKFDSIVAFADIGDFLDAPVKHYSSGMYVRLGFAIAVHCDPDILLIDEVLAVGDTGFQNKCLNEIGRLRKNGTTTILVSHNMHAISIYSDKVTLLNHGKARNFDDVSAAVMAYTDLFAVETDTNILKNCSGNENIRFHTESFPKRSFVPGDAFDMSIKYSSNKVYDDVIIDVAILSGNEPGFYFEGTNNAYGKKIDLPSGEHELRLRVDDIRINKSTARVDVAVWAKGKFELLLWWSIPVEYSGVAHSTGKNFLNVSYDVK